MWLTALGGHSEWRTIAKTGRPGCCSYLLNSQFQYRAWVKDASQSCTPPNFYFILFYFLHFWFHSSWPQPIWPMPRISPASLHSFLHVPLFASILTYCSSNFLSISFSRSILPTLCLFFMIYFLCPFLLPSFWPFLFMSSVSFFFLVTYFFVSPLSFLLIFFLHFVLLSFYILLYSYFFVFLLYSCLMSFIFSMLPCVLIPFITCVLPSNCMSFILSLPLLHFFLVFFVCLWTLLYFMLKFSTLQNHLP